VPGPSSTTRRVPGGSAATMRWARWRLLGDTAAMLNGRRSHCRKNIHSSERAERETEVGLSASTGDPVWGSPIIASRPPLWRYAARHRPPGHAPVRAWRLAVWAKKWFFSQLRGERRTADPAELLFSKQQNGAGRGRSGL